MTPDDSDLRDAFSHQRRLDRSHAPAWNPALLQASQKQKRRPSLGLLWLPAAAAACAAAMLWLGTGADDSPHDLAQALPVFFEPQGEPLFASIDSAGLMPTDSLLPVHLTIHLP